MAERDLSWYWRRLRSMGAREVAYRVVERYRKLAAKGRYEGWQHYHSPGPVPCVPGLREAVDRSPSGLLALAADAGARLVDARFRALGVQWPSLPGGEIFPADLWRLDPVTGRHWPDRSVYCFDISYRHERVLGDVKYVWEINRLQFLQPMSLLARLDKGDRALGMIETALNSWYDANPPFKGISWCSGIELALRSISILIVSSLCGDRLSPAVQVRIRSMLTAHFFWMRRYPSLYSSANNHLVAEAAGEYLIALCMPELPGAMEAKQHARAVLEEESLRQILADGVSAEQSPTYGAFTAEFLLLSAFAAKAAGEPLASHVEERLLAFAEAIACMSGGGGRPPAIGDDDEGRVVADCTPEPAYAVSIASAVAAFTGAPALVVAPRECVLRQVFFGTASGPKERRLPTYRSFLVGGYSIVHEYRAGREVFLLVDHGSLGYLSLAAHGHADALSICLTLDGVPVFVDPGTYLYHSGGAWREWFRGTAAHNSVVVHGENQSVITGSFNWSERAIARLDSFQQGPDWHLCASHDGYLRRFGVRHERVVVAMDRGIRLRDSLVGRGGGQPAELVFRLAHDLSVEREGHAVAILLGNERLAVVHFDRSGQLSLARGESRVDGGWVSPSFGRKVAAWRIAWKGMVGAKGTETQITWP